MEIEKALKGVDRPFPALLSVAQTGEDLELLVGPGALFGITFKEPTIDTTKRPDWQLFPFPDFHAKKCALVRWVLDPFNGARPGYKPYLHLTVTFGTDHNQIVELTSEAQIVVLAISERPPWKQSISDVPMIMVL